MTNIHFNEKNTPWNVSKTVSIKEHPVSLPGVLTGLVCVAPLDGEVGDPTLRRRHLDIAGSRGGTRGGTTLKIKQSNQINILSKMESIKKCKNVPNVSNQMAELCICF